MTLAELEEQKTASLNEVASAAPGDIEALRVKYVGRNGLIPALIKAMKDVPKEERPSFGKAVQAWRAEMEAALAGRAGASKREEPEVKADLTLPGRWFGLGVRHPLSRVIEESAAIFSRLGFTVADGPELETPFNNFTALNTPPHHPSQDRTDTFWFGDDCLLRTQTSPVQIRTMMSNKPPIRVICPGRTFRRDTTDATHSANFHQIEGLYVDTLPERPVSLADLKSVLAYFAKEMMGDGVTVRFRPHFFPFTEPSVEVDFTCHVCKGRGCGVCKQSGWIEVAGAGMVDPRVFRHVGYNPDEVSGYAFGFGVERIAMIKYGIPDIRWFYENDVRFLEQLG
ncbi:MAG: phenylalanine--tRNA ligase subunit alpha [Kiritimatiellae bacterium]|jgi:phenylalanyl-tRNA synthetase alpha chain|nr:phenylalanine--tRNA ligase subunit alpha [Kiritimatiellia bacterium]